MLKIPLTDEKESVISALSFIRKARKLLVPQSIAIIGAAITLEPTRAIYEDHLPKAEKFRRQMFAQSFLRKAMASEPKTNRNMVVSTFPELEWKPRKNSNSGNTSDSSTLLRRSCSSAYLSYRP